MDASTGRSGRVITVLNLKGGVGKTHTVWLLASVCQERDLRVLVIDTDVQGNLTSSFLAGEDAVPGVEQLLHPGSDRDIHRLIRRTAFPHIDCVPASSALSAFDVSDQSAWEKAELHHSFVGPIEAVRDRYDFVLIDCPPRLSLVSFAALCASDGIVIPMEAADWGAMGIVQVTEAVRYVQEHHNARLKLLGYLVSRFKRSRLYQQAYLKQLRHHFGPLAFDTTVADLSAFERAVTDRTPIVQKSRRSVAAGIARQLFDEVLRRLDGAEPDGGRGGGAADLRREGEPVAAR
jgi:chromosome partitioning protein